VWIDDTHFRVGDVDFACSGADSTVECFSIRKPRHLVEATVDLARRFSAPRIFELGIARGGSTALLALAGEPSRLVAAELDAERVGALDQLIEQRGLAESIRPFYGVDQGNRSQLAAIADEQFGDGPLDLVIDDASHRLHETRVSFEVLYPRLRPGGLYVIEDWNWQLQLQYGIAGRPGDTGDSARTPPGAVLPGGGDADSASAAFRDYARENVRRTPLEILALELVVARACSGHAVAEIVIGENWVVARRGAGELDRNGFRLAGHYVGAQDLLARSED
jgi:SAM-dependent methyltransferase